MPNRLRVYVAGAYSADNVLAVLDNMRIGMRASTLVMLAGFAPFCPWLDYQFQLSLRGDEKLTVEDYYNYSLAWLSVSNAMYLAPNPKNAESRGTQKEIAKAQELDIPVFECLDKLREWGIRHAKSASEIPRT